MNFIFSFGEHYYSGDDSSLLFQVLLNFLGAFFGFGFSLLLFYKQNKEDRRRENLGRREEKEKEEELKRLNYKKILIYYKELLASIDLSFDKQLIQIDEYILKQNSNLTELQTLFQVATQDFHRLKNIDNKGVFEAWNYYFKGADTIKDYKNTNSSLDLLEGIKEDILRVHLTHKRQCYDQMLQVKQIIDHIPDVLSSIALNLTNQLGDSRWENEYYHFINNAIKEYTNLIESKASFDQLNDEFLYPLLDQILEKYSQVSETEQIVMLCKKARVKLNDIRSETSQVLEEFGKARGKAERHLKIIQNTIRRIEHSLR